jgi:hypothetical protein
MTTNDPKVEPSMTPEQLDVIRLTESSFLSVFYERYSKDASNNPVSKYRMHLITAFGAGRNTYLVGPRPFQFEDGKIFIFESQVSQHGMPARLIWDDMTQSMKDRIVQSGILPVEFKPEPEKWLAGKNANNNPRCFVYGKPDVLAFLSATYVP